MTRHRPMRDVPRSEYVAVVRTLPHAWSRPIETLSFSAMQWVDPETNRVVAQSLYEAGKPPIYQLPIGD